MCITNAGLTILHHAISRISKLKDFVEVLSLKLTEKVFCQNHGFSGSEGR